MANVIYAPEADDDLFGIVEYIARDKPVTAREWLRKIRETCETIATQPELANCGQDLECQVPVHSASAIT